MKTFSKFEIAALKRTAENVDRYISKRDRILEKINKLDSELREILQLLEIADAPTKAITGGYGSEDLFEKVVTDTGKVDKNGNPVKITKFNLKYPDTVLPPKIEYPLLTEEALEEKENEEYKEDNE